MTSGGKCLLLLRCYSKWWGVGVLSRLFISYIEEDGAIARQIADGLEAAGYRPWYYERDSLPGIAYLNQVQDAISHSRAFIALLSAPTLKSRQVDIEITAALDRRLFFIPLLHKITYAQFRKRRPDWALAFGAASATVVPPEGVSELMPAILRSLKQARIPGSMTVLTNAPRLLVRGDGIPDTTYFMHDGLTLGRDADNDIVLPHDTVSRKHAQIKMNNGGIAVMDLRSRNKTFLSGQMLEPMKPHNWTPGDTLEIGPFRLSVQPPTPSAF